MEFTYKEIVESLPQKKNSKSSLWVKFVIRKLSFIFTYIFINLGFSAWGASMFSIFVAIVGCIALSIDVTIYRTLGVILIEFWLVMDCVDGNIARVKKTSSVMGEFTDAQSGYVISGFVYLALGIAGYNTSSLIIGENAFLIIIIGAIGSISDILSRLIHQKYTYTLLIIEKNSGIKYKVESNKQDENKGLQYIRNRIDKEIGISGLFMPMLILALLFNKFDLMTIFYSAYTVTALFAVIVMYALKAKKI